MVSKTLMAAAIALAGCFAAAPAAAASKIDRVLVVSETTDTLVLEIRYSYDGRQGGRVFATARMTKGGKSLNHYSVRPGAVERGSGRTRVALGVNQRAPSLFESDGLRVALYKGGGSPFVSATYRFAKTWAKARTALSPTLAVVGVARPAAQGRVMANPGFSGGGGSAGDPGGTVTRRIHADGTVEIRYADGSRTLLRDGSMTKIDPQGNKQTFMYSSAQPPTPPGAPPNAQHGAWVEGQAAQLLTVIQTLVGNHQPSVDAYLASESGLSPYGKVSERTKTIGRLVE